MHIKRNLSDCRANKWAISAFFTCTTGMKNENKKIRKNFQRTIFILRLNFSEKIFWEDSVAAGCCKGGAAYYSEKQPIHVQHGRIVSIFAFCELANTRLKAAAKHHYTILPPCMARGRCVCFLCNIVLVACCKIYAECLHAPRPRFYYPHFCAFFCFRLYVYHLSFFVPLSFCPLCCYFLLLCFALLTYLLAFFSFLYSCTLFLVYI